MGLLTFLVQTAYESFIRPDCKSLCFRKVSHLLFIQVGIVVLSCNEEMMQGFVELKNEYLDKTLLSHYFFFFLQKHSTYWNLTVVARFAF